MDQVTTSNHVKLPFSTEAGGLLNQRLSLSESVFLHKNSVSIQWCATTIAIHIPCEYICYNDKLTPASLKLSTEYPSATEMRVTFLSCCAIE